MIITGRMRRFILALISVCWAVGSVMGADTSVQIFNPKFRTLQVMPNDNFMGMPVVRLGSDDRLIVTFDELGDDYSYLQYRLLHCNADWQPSALVESEYLDGFNVADITDYAFSSNTYVHYVNYRIELPNEDMNPKVSGNYLLQVFRQDNPEDVLLQTRFSVSEHAAAVGGEATSRTDKGLNTEWQQLNLTVSTPGMTVRSPLGDIFLTVNQNGRPDAVRTILRPQRLQGKSLVYEHIPDLIFPAGNEYRRFETVRVNYPGMGVDSVGFSGRNYHAWLVTDQSRVSRPYVYDQTQNGRFKVDEYNSTNPDLGADYVSVHFELHHPEVMNADIYVEGDLVGNRHDDVSRMRYDHSRHSYVLTLPLKQGSYNYQYVALPKSGHGIGDPGLMEGNKYETRNEYQVYVWLRESGSRADRLIGTGQLFNR